MSQYQDLLDEVHAIVRRGDDAACPDLADVVEGLLVELVAQEAKNSSAAVGAAIEASIKAEFTRQIKEAGSRAGGLSSR